MSPATDLAAGSIDREDARTRPRATLWTLRGATLVHTALLVGQPVFAGLYLSGDFDALEVHAFNADLVSMLALVQAAAALVYFVAGRGRGWPAVFSFVLFLAEGFQIGMGYSRELAVHIPLGVGIVVTQILFTVWLFGRGARWSRPRRGDRTAAGGREASSPAAS